MKKINLINLILMSVLIIFILYDNYKDKNNIKVHELALTNNYNDLYSKYLKEENEHLKELLNITTSTLNAIVVRGYFINTYNEFIISKGKKDGVEEGAILINNQRLIGIVNNVRENYSSVELLENLDKKISIKVGNNYGFLESKNNQVIITGLNGKDMKIKDEIYTSGLTPIPGDIYIGKIKKIDENDEIFKTIAYVELSQDYENYKYLLVINK